MDALYLFRHSKANDLEIKYSLRSMAKYLPYIRKVWIFGDRPAFISSDESRIEHVSHEAITRLDKSPTPLRNTFKMLFFSSLIGDLSPGYLWMCDDYVLLDFVTFEELQRNRYVENMDEVPVRGSGLYKEAMWRTYDVMKKLGYPGYSFDSHCPTYLRKRWVFDAYCDFQDYVTDDRFYGIIGSTAILNHATKHERLALTHVASENWRAGFYEKCPPYSEIVQQCRGRRFLSFDDEGFGDNMLRFLDERFPEPCVYEKDGVPDNSSFGSTELQQLSFSVQIQQTVRGTVLASTANPAHIFVEAATHEMALEELSRRIRKARRSG